MNGMLFRNSSTSAICAAVFQLKLDNCAVQSMHFRHRQTLACRTNALTCICMER